MSDNLSKPEPDDGKAQSRVRRVYLLVELIALLLLVGAVLWLAQNYHPRTFLGRGLLNHKLWILVLLVSGWGTAGSLIPYYVGQRGTKAVFTQYPRLEGQRWERIVALFERWGALGLVLSGVPVLGASLLVVAGAVGIRRLSFLFWVFLGKVLRNWVLAFAVLLGLQLVG